MSARLVRRGLLVAAACAWALGCALPAHAITPVLPVDVADGAQAQVEHDAAQLSAFYTALGIDPALAGSGVKVAVIDSGIAVYPPSSPFKTNPCFADASYPEHERLGDAAFTNNKVFVARMFMPRPYKDSDATPAPSGPHGSHVAGIIGCDAGTPAVLSGTTVGTISGVAPHVLLGSYNVFPAEQFGAGTAELARAIDAAVADGMDIISMSLGGEPTKDDVRVLAALRRAERAGVLVVAAAGNEGPHASTIGSPGIFPTVLTVGSTTGGRAVETTLTVGSHSFTGSVGDIGIPVRPTSAPLFVARGRHHGLAWGCESIPRAAAGKIVVLARGSCLFSDKLSNVKRAGGVGAVVVSAPGQQVVAMSSPSERVLNLAALMLPFSQARELVALEGEQASFSPPRLVVEPSSARPAVFSSRGPALVTGLVKPDVLAPGEGIVSAASASSVSESCGVAGQCFQLMSGTSMSTPFVTGIAAVLKQAHPGWSPAQLRSAIIHTASPVAAASPFAVGAGMVSPVASAAPSFFIFPSSLLLTPSRTAFVTVMNDSDEVRVFTLSSTRPWLHVTSTLTLGPHSSTRATVRASAVGLASIWVSDGISSQHLVVRSR